MTAPKNQEIPIEEIEMLRVQLLNERVVSAREAAASAALNLQVRQAELDAAVKGLTHKYNLASEGMELKGLNLQNKTLIVGPAKSAE
jgi:hypothetical protein